MTATDPEARLRQAEREILARRPEHSIQPSLDAEGVTVELDTAATIDVAAERRRMEKDLAAARKEADQAERKLANDAFLAKAPGEVVDETRRRLEAAWADIARISGRLAALSRGEA